ncbi:Protein of unknown function [Shimia gijangensis]|uniref:Methyltransferase domain-containing protein n=1 Tax=Shimia gijangensis TaxID=1470563 RepID=A0A1M6R6H4_9RHOB|nr:DUF938 domain-containing protein [Shimia gijangensis]SHK28075.1 Protein of unknown function [Shimia gijangensis]
MPRRLNLPDTASVAQATEDGRMFAPSAARNAEAIVALVCDRAPEQGRALEIASGTGQHVVQLAKARPGLHWQPSEVDAARRASIDVYVAEAGLKNISPATDLDATAHGWHADHGGQDFIMLVNLLHLISEGEARVLVNEAAGALSSGGTLMIYGPFMRDDAMISEGDASFHASLQAQDPEIGYKSDFDVLDWAVAAGLEFADMVEMPANNLAIILRKPA